MDGADTGDKVVEGENPEEEMEEQPLLGPELLPELLELLWIRGEIHRRVSRCRALFLARGRGGGNVN